MENKATAPLHLRVQYKFIDPYNILIMPLNIDDLSKDEKIIQSQFAACNRIVNFPNRGFAAWISKDKNSHKKDCDLSQLQQANSLNDLQPMGLLPIDPRILNETELLIILNKFKESKSLQISAVSNTNSVAVIQNNNTMQPLDFLNNNNLNNAISQIKSDERFKSETEGVYGFVHDRDRILKKGDVSFKIGNLDNAQLNLSQQDIYQLIMQQVAQNLISNQLLLGAQQNSVFPNPYSSQAPQNFISNNPGQTNNTISQIKLDKSFKSETEQVVRFVHDRDRILKKDEGSFKSGNWYNMLQNTRLPSMKFEDVKPAINCRFIESKSTNFFDFPRLSIEGNPTIFKIETSAKDKNLYCFFLQFDTSAFSKKLTSFMQKFLYNHFKKFIPDFDFSINRSDMSLQSLGFDYTIIYQLNSFLITVSSSFLTTEQLTIFNSSSTKTEQDLRDIITTSISQTKAQEIQKIITLTKECFELTTQKLLPSVEKMNDPYLYRYILYKNCMITLLHANKAPKQIDNVPQIFNKNLGEIYKLSAANSIYISPFLGNDYFIVYAHRNNYELFDRNTLENAKTINLGVSKFSTNWKDSIVIAHKSQLYCIIGEHTAHFNFDNKLFNLLSKAEYKNISEEQINKEFQKFAKENNIKPNIPTIKEFSDTLNKIKFDIRKVKKLIKVKTIGTETIYAFYESQDLTDLLDEFKINLRSAVINTNMSLSTKLEYYGCHSLRIGSQSIERIFLISDRYFTEEHKAFAKSISSTNSNFKDELEPYFVNNKEREAHNIDFITYIITIYEMTKEYCDRKPNEPINIYLSDALRYQNLSSIANGWRKQDVYSITPGLEEKIYAFNHIFHLEKVLHYGHVIYIADHSDESSKRIANKIENVLKNGQYKKSRVFKFTNLNNKNEEKEISCYIVPNFIFNHLFANNKHYLQETGKKDAIRNSRLDAFHKEYTNLLHINNAKDLLFSNYTCNEFEKEILLKCQEFMGIDTSNTISQIKSINDSGADESFKDEGEQVVRFVHDRDRDQQKDEGSFKNGNWYNKPEQLERKRKTSDRKQEFLQKEEKAESSSSKYDKKSKTSEKKEELPVVKEGKQEKEQPSIVTPANFSTKSQIPYNFSIDEEETDTEVDIEAVDLNYAENEDTPAVTPEISFPTESQPQNKEIGK